MTEKENHGGCSTSLSLLPRYKPQLWLVAGGVLGSTGLEVGGLATQAVVANPHDLPGKNMQF